MSYELNVILHQLGFHISTFQYPVIINKVMFITIFTWKNCDKHYMGKTHHNLEKRIYKHKWSIKLNDYWNALFSHMLDLKHIFNFSQVTLIKPIHCKKSLWRLESTVISKTKHIKQWSSFYRFHPTWQTLFYIRIRSK